MLFHCLLHSDLTAKGNSYPKASIGRYNVECYHPPSVLCFCLPKYFSFYYKTEWHRN